MRRNIFRRGPVTDMIVIKELFLRTRHFFRHTSRRCVLSAAARVNLTVRRHAVALLITSQRLYCKLDVHHKSGIQDTVHRGVAVVLIDRVQ